AAPAAAGLIAGVAGVAAPFVMLGGLLFAAAGLGARKRPGGAEDPRGTHGRAGQRVTGRS
ncbi:MFS transporter, partial [Streptomyces sp. SID10115]|nr:MFS transporter [Streptomyces sp. SID10115]